MADVYFFYEDVVIEPGSGVHIYLKIDNKLLHQQLSSPQVLETWKQVLLHKTNFLIGTKFVLKMGGVDNVNLIYEAEEELNSLYFSTGNDRITVVIGEETWATIFEKLNSYFSIKDDDDS